MWAIPCLVGVYPRVCGGSPPCSHSISVQPGLSPRVRGKHRPSNCPPFVARSIPACAGEARLCVLSGVANAVYPRVCGGSLMRLPEGSKVIGLSPRVRGKRTPAAPLWCTGGSIPACAGEAVKGNLTGVGDRVYPRVCGGSRRRRASIFCHAGLSPRVRGKPQRNDRAAGDFRSIPACAGEASECRNHLRHLRVYPRVCGGSILLILIEDDSDGLSPRVRGKRMCRPPG